MNQSLREQAEFIWKSFCDVHQGLYVATCEEYQMLIRGDVKKLERKVEDKINIIKEIKSVELKREKLISEINDTIENEDEKIKNASDLLTHYEDSECLVKYNKILLEEIEKIQNQGKKNKLFINLAMRNLSNVKGEITGENKGAMTYNNRGFIKGGKKLAGL